MHAPYTDHATEAYQIAEVATGALLSVVGWPLLQARSVRATWTMAIWLTVATPLLLPWFSEVKWQLGAITALLVLTLLLARRLIALLIGVPVVTGLYVASRFLKDSNLEVCAAYLCAAGLVLGLLAPPWHRAVLSSPAAPPRALSARWHDFALFVIAIVMGALVSHFVLLRAPDGSDEWAYTYQAAVMAKGQLYGKLPPCHSALRNFWLFWRDDRMFAQYQLGWPLLLVPFVWMRAVWLGGPVTLGLLAVAVARLARQAALRGSFGRADVLRAGWLAAGVTLLSSTVLINGGSRFPHLLVAALFAFVAENALVLARSRGFREAFPRALLLGSTAGYLVLVRAPDACVLAVGPLLYLAIATVRRRTHWSTIPLAALASIPWLVFLFVTAHAQLREWGVLPYQLTTTFYPWNVVGFSLPPAHHWKWSFPLAWGAYCWFPLTPALGIVGMALMTRERWTRGVAFTLGFSALASMTFYGLLTLGRGGDFGYGPRYQLVLVVPMAVGAALLLLRVLTRMAAPMRALVRTALVTTVATGVLLLSCEQLMSANSLLTRVTAVEREVKAQGLRRAVVIVTKSAAFYGPMDLTRNYPIELYDPEVIFANENETMCLREAFADRTFFKAVGKPPKLVPYEETP